LYNWAHSIIDIYGISMKKIYYGEVKRLSISDDNSEEIALIPGLNLFKNGSFKLNTGNNLATNLFAYREHIYLNSDRFIEENDEVFNEIQFIPNTKLFKLTGRTVNGYYHEEIIINANTKKWTLKKISLCKDLPCFHKGKNTPEYTIKYEINNYLINFCQ
jgi:hypothetical protein